jgi:hypothetical protein
LIDNKKSWQLVNLISPIVPINGQPVSYIFTPRHLLSYAVPTVWSFSFATRMTALLELSSITPLVV